MASWRPPEHLPSCGRLVPPSAAGVVSLDAPRRASVVRYACHAEAVAAVSANEAALAEGTAADPSLQMALAFNERQYRERGWCVFEEAAAAEVIGRSTRYTEGQRALDSIRIAKVRVVAP
jgi:hypothetical protein